MIIAAALCSNVRLVPETHHLLPLVYQAPDGDVYVDPPRPLSWYVLPLSFL